MRGLRVTGCLSAAVLVVCVIALPWAYSSLGGNYVISAAMFIVGMFSFALGYLAVPVNFIVAAVYFVKLARKREVCTDKAWFPLALTCVTIGYVFVAVGYLSKIMAAFMSV